MPQEHEGLEPQIEAAAPAVQAGPGPALGAAMPRIPAGASNAAIARAAAAGSFTTGVPSNAHAALRALGAQASSVRLHPGADAALAHRPGALAMTAGTDIHLSSAAPALDTPGGELLLAHEAVHVRQQTAPGPAVSREVAEGEADRAAVAATLGAPIGALSAAEGPLYFEAKWHQASLTGAMKQLGFSDKEAQAAYFGNWCRDLSQALVPMARDTIGTQAAFQLVNLLAMHKFGHGVTPAELGAYDPRQHIDNPAGTTDRDVLPSGVTIAGQKPGDEHAAGPEDSSALEPDNIAKSFEVSAAGVPAYMEDSRRLAEAEALKAIEAGRTPQGMMHVGTFSHIIEDLFAHSNWIEIAVGRVLKENPGLIPQGATGDEVRANIAANKPPVENFAADVASKGNAARPILSTGTFTGGSTGNDTMISVKAELQNLLRDREPFKEDGGGGEMYDFAIEVLKKAEASADEGSLGDIFTAVVEQAAANLGSSAIGAASELPGKARAALGDGVLGDLAAGAASLVAEGAEEAGELASDAWKAGLKEVIKDAANSLGGAISLAEIAVYLKGGANSIAEAWKHLKEGVASLPEAIRELLLPKLVAAEREFKKRLRALANAAYGRAVEVLVDQVESLSGRVDAAETNVGVKEQDLQRKLGELKTTMINTLNEVGGSEGAKVAAQIATMSQEDVAAFAMSDAYKTVLAGLVDDIAAKARLDAAAGSMSDTAHTLNQLANVPDWAKAGASHSQTAKDHDDAPFFGIAFRCAQEADHRLMGALMAAWEKRGFTGPASELAGDFDPAEKTGNEAEDARRKKFLDTRRAGDFTVAHGEAESKNVGPRLAELAAGLEEVVNQQPIAGPVLRGLIWALRHDSDVAAVEAELKKTRAEWETEAATGRFDHSVMEAIDVAIGTLTRALGVMGKDEHGHDHPVDSKHPQEHHDDKDTHDEDESHEHGGRNETMFNEQKAALNKHRGTGAVAATAGVGADRETPAAEQIVADIREIFDHPYESQWWYASVKDWCTKNGPALERSLRDRNAGVMHSH
jgi:hypothetical protein